MFFIMWKELQQVFFKRFRDPIRVPRILNRVPRIRENHHRIPKIRENWVPRIREIESLQIHTRYLTFSLKKNLVKVKMMHPTAVLYQLDRVGLNLCLS